MTNQVAIKQAITQAKVEAMKAGVQAMAAAMGVLGLGVSQQSQGLN